MPHTFRVATVSDRDTIVAFLSSYWSNKHIFVRCPELLEWQHRTPGSETLNFMLAIDSDSGKLESLLGFIPTSRFDSSLKDQNDYWGAIWKNAKGQGLIGLQLLMEFHRQLDVGTYAGIGLSAEAIKIYKALNYTVGEMEHYFIPSSYSSQKLFSAPQSNLPKQIYPSATLRLITSNDLFKSTIVHNATPKKTPQFLLERYVTHPVYSYQLYSVESGCTQHAIIVTRVDTVEDVGASCLHIVDWFGSWMAPVDLREALLSLLVEKECEYVDMVCRVEVPAHFTKIGFRLKKPETETVPLYFAPFCKENIQLHYFVKDTPNYCLFKGDSDQDRPNHCLG
jgi:hypothetical protein